MDTEKQKRFILQFAFWLLAGSIVYALLKYALPLITPFIIGFLVSLMLRPLSVWLAKITRLNQKVVAILILVLFYSAIGTLLIVSGVKIAKIIGDFVVTLPDYYTSTVAPGLSRLLNDLTSFLNALDPSLQTTMQNLTGNIISSLAGVVTSYSTAALNWLTGFAGALPMFLIDFIIAVISSFFVSADYPGIKSFLLLQLKPRQLEILRMIRDNVKSVLGNYLKAYVKLMSLTFLELLVGLSLAGVRGAAPIALGIAVFDILPVVGTGTIVLPWVLIELLAGNISRAVKLLIMYAVIAAVRNFLEPRLIGRQIGLHPLITLLCMYVGASLFGIVGLFGLPITASILKKLNENGTIKLYHMNPD